ncbi:MAG: FliA/WhiG family RNA polymerase sigma factor [Deltaproteobacteria bacterium]|nr:FliA/WhiG family RNA polymerase sigma factor [Deltaproteobacteria bacterium]
MSLTYGKKKNTSDRDTLVKEYAPLVKIIATRLAMRLPSHIDIEELINVGVAGLLEAIDRYDPSKGVKMETFFTFRIKGAMLDDLRRLDWTPRSVRQKARQIESELAHVGSRLGRLPTENEMAESLGMEVEDYQRFLSEASGLSILSIEDLGLSPEGDEKNILECIADPDGMDPVTALNMKQTQRLLTEAIEAMPEKEKLVLSLYYL